MVSAAKHNTIPELESIGLDYPQWQDALEAAYATGKLSVIGELAEGQLLQYADPTGATLTILAAPPYGSFAGFSPLGASSVTAHVSMVNDLIGVVDIVADNPLLQVSGAAAPVFASLTATIAQGPLIAEQEPQEYQQLTLAALATNVRVYPDSVAFAQDGGESVGSVDSLGLAQINSGATTPHAQAEVSIEVSDAELKTNELTGQKFWQLSCRHPFDFSLVLPADHPDVGEQTFSAPGAIVKGKVQFSASINSPAGCGPSGCGSGDCGCGGH